VRSGIELHVNEKQTISMTLEVGDVTLQVTVEASVPQVEMQSPAGTGLISGTEVREIALNNRNYAWSSFQFADGRDFHGAVNPTGGGVNAPPRRPTSVYVYHTRTGQ